MDRRWTYVSPDDEEYWPEGAVSDAGFQLRLAVNRLLDDVIVEGEDTRDPLNVIRALRWLERSLALEYAFLVAQARVEGASWSEIANAFKLTKQAVQQRFSEPINKLLPYCTSEDRQDGEEFLDMLDKYYTGRRSIWADSED
ncbi:hypothetical protein ACWEVP_06075 [Amycolatopsis sp. NPDC003865]